MLELIDTHIHLDDEKYDLDLPDVLDRAKQVGVTTMLNAGSTVNANKRILELIKKHESIVGAIGLHPHEFPGTALDAIKQLPMQLAHEKIVALGEIGLDYHLFPDYPPPDRTLQQAAFRAQLKLAKIMELPLIIHVREAMDDALAIIKEEGPFPNHGVMHCYAGGEHYLQDVLDLGFYIGIGGPVTYPKADDIRQVVEVVPVDRLLLETDAPYLPPQGKRGKRHEPAWMMDSANLIADIKGMSIDQLGQVTTNNAKRLFKLNKDCGGPIVYEIKGHLYVNLTNRCSSHCTFCPRQVKRVVQSYDLTLEREPVAKEIIAHIGDPKQYSEIVFCGFGEPLLRLPVLLEVAKFVKEQGGKVRINTNGQADVLFNQDILPSTKGLIDHWSISVNSTNEADYMKHVRPATGAGTHQAVMDFTTRAVKVADVTITDVDMPGIDISGMEPFAKTIGAHYRGRHFQRLGEPEASR